MWDAHYVWEALGKLESVVINQGYVVVLSPAVRRVIAVLSRNRAAPR